MTLTEMWLTLFEHDWAYQWSDDAAHWRLGNHNHNLIVAAAASSEENRALLDVWKAMQGEDVKTLPVLQHRGFEVQRRQKDVLWSITRNGLEIATAYTPRKAIEAIDENMDVIDLARALEHPFPLEVICAAVRSL